MKLFVDILPDLSGAIEDELRTTKQFALADQISSLGVRRWNFHEMEDAGYVHLIARELNVVDRKTIRERYDHSIEIESISGMVVVDIDNFGRITGVELINRNDVFRRLQELCPELRDSGGPK